MLDWEPVSEEVLRSWGGRVHEQMTKASDAALRWQRRSVEIDDYCQRRNYDAIQRRDVRSKDPELIDLMSAQEWHRCEANRFSHAILAEEALRRMLAK